MPEQVIISWDRFQLDVARLCKVLDPKSLREVYGVPRGGSYVALELSKYQNFIIVDQPTPGCLVVDDLVDSGTTMERFQGTSRAALYRKPQSPEHVATTLTTIDGWIKFPWEVEEGPDDAILRLLQWVGEDPKRDGLIDTPKRVLKAFKEMTSGYQECPADILSKIFEEPYDEVVISRAIPFTSLCEHHLLPFTGTVDVGYLPSRRGVVGLSKLARLVDCFSKRLQVQERMTRQIADSIMTHLVAQGAAVVVRAEHSCMACRGVKKAGSEMVTSCMLGVFRDKPEARAEFLSLCGR